MLIFVRCLEQCLAHSKLSVLVHINKTSSTVHSSKGFYLFAALWWPVNILEDSKCKVDPLYAGHSADNDDYDDGDDGSTCLLFN